MVCKEDLILFIIFELNPFFYQQRQKFACQNASISQSPQIPNFVGLSLEKRLISGRFYAREYESKQFCVGY